MDDNKLNALAFLLRRIEMVDITKITRDYITHVGDLACELLQQEDKLNALAFLLDVLIEAFNYDDELGEVNPSLCDLLSTVRYVARERDEQGEDWHCECPVESPSDRMVSPPERLYGSNPDCPRHGKASND